MKIHEVHFEDLTTEKDINIIIENQEETERLRVDKVLSLKDKVNLSDKKYNLLRKEFGFQKVLPGINKLVKERKIMDNLMKLFENKHGVYVDAEEKIKQILTSHYRLYQNNFEMNEKIRIKLSGDGTNVKQMHLLNFTFALPDFNHGQAAKGNFSLGVYEIIKEDYNELKSCFAELIPILRNIKTFEIDDKIFKIEFYLAGDLKFLANVLGINSANSDFGCVWCTAHKSNFNMDWSISDSKFGARSHEDSLLKRQNKNHLNRLGYLEAPIFDFILFKNVIIDLLHLFLRISDKLTAYILDDLFILDGYQSTYENTNDPKIQNSKNIYAYIQFLTHECHIRNCFYLKEKKIVFRQLRGNEKLVLLDKINLVKLFPDIEDVKTKNDVIHDFNFIYLSIRDNTIDAENIQILTSKFILDYTEAFMIQSITPYLHCFVCHLHEFRSLHGNFNLFNMQGLEKLNDITSEQVFKSTKNNTGNLYFFCPH